MVTPSPYIDPRIVDNARNMLNSCKTEMNSAMQAGLISPLEEIDDPVFKRINKAMKHLSTSIDDCSFWTPSHGVATSTSNFGDKLYSLSKMLKNTSSGTGGNMVKDLKKAQSEVDNEMVRLRAATSQRSWANAMGSFYLLAHCRRLSSESHKNGVGLTGRFEETGGEIYFLASQTVKIDQDLRDWKRCPCASADEKIISSVSRLYNQLGIAFDATIAFLLSFPFELDNFQYATKELKRNSDIIHDIIKEGIVFSSRSSKGKKKKGYMFLSADGKDLTKHDPIAQDIDAIIVHLNTAKVSYERSKAKYKASQSRRFTEPHLRVLTQYNLSEGDLLNTSTVVQVMTKPREENGLGLPVLCTGNELAPLKTKSGGYGLVSCMRQPNENYTKSNGRLVAVKTSHDQHDNYFSLAFANLRTLREAVAWASVSRDRRKRSGGGQYLAQVMGIWDNFQDNRPGLVSLWADCDINTLNKKLLSKRNKIELAYKIAQAVHFLHTCKPIVIHGDLKGANILMINGEPLLTDFGFAKCLGSVPGLTTGNPSYTDNYRPPELELSELSLVDEPTTASDVYAFGCLLYEILSGFIPFDGFDRGWQSLENSEDFTPIDVEMRKPNPVVFDESHLRLMKWCFKFHPSRRPPMRQVVSILYESLLALQAP